MEGGVSLKDLKETGLYLSEFDGLELKPEVSIPETVFDITNWL